MLPAALPTGQPLWWPLRQGVGSAEQMLGFLAQSGKRSLLGDYACLRPVPCNIGAQALGRGAGREPPGGMIPHKGVIPQVGRAG
jgi:hypothetical protein